MMMMMMNSKRQVHNFFKSRNEETDQNCMLEIIHVDEPEMILL